MICQQRGRASPANRNLTWQKNCNPSETWKAGVGRHYVGEKTYGSSGRRIELSSGQFDGCCCTRYEEIIDLKHRMVGHPNTCLLVLHAHNVLRWRNQSFRLEKYK